MDVQRQSWFSVPPSNFVGDMPLGSGIISNRSGRFGNISNVTSFQSCSRCPALPKDAMIAQLCSSAVESSAMIDPERHIDFKSPASLMMLMTTFTNCF